MERGLDRYVKRGVERGVERNVKQGVERGVERNMERLWSFGEDVRVNKVICPRHESILVGRKNAIHGWTDGPTNGKKQCLLDYGALVAIKNGDEY